MAVPKLKAVEEHLQEKRRHASFRELQGLDEEKLKVAKVIIGERIRRRLSHVFALNRKTGIAVWSKSRSKGLLTLNPDVQSYVLGCEPR